MNTYIRYATVPVAFISAFTSTSFGGADERVYSVLFPKAAQYSQYVEFADDGSTMAFMQRGSNHDLYIRRGNEWNLAVSIIGNEAGSGPVGVFGISDDGSRVGYSDGHNTILLEEGRSTYLPTTWFDIGGRPVWGDVFGQVISGDGNAVGMTGFGNSGQRPVHWNGGRYLRDMTVFDDMTGVAGSGVNALSHDGGVGVGSKDRRFSNATVGFSYNTAWIWEGRETTDIPNLDLGEFVDTRPQAISGDGTVVAGTSSGISVLDPEIGGVERSASHAWLWSESDGLVDVFDAERFESIYAIDLSDDGQVLLGGATDLNDNNVQVLWSEVGGIILIDDLFESLGIGFEADSYRFTQISADGTRLMGTKEFEGQFSAVIVTIPTPSTLMLGVGFGLLATRRRRC
ncbi:MAG: hypothetical protein JKY96_03320 [Phycisphaerales bacterium]|nr:hypothetical protein [Phycisphaerales bacterium]